MQCSSLRGHRLRLPEGLDPDAGVDSDGPHLSPLEEGTRDIDKTAQYRYLLNHRSITLYGYYIARSEHKRGRSAYYPLPNPGPNPHYIGLSPAQSACPKLAMVSKLVIVAATLLFAVVCTASTDPEVTHKAR